jgi:EAL domain-containing protein (putative c-di-GMP-specific phosphodiesterase class I)
VAPRRQQWGERRLVDEVGELAEAIEADQLALAYQPVVDLVRNRVVGAEALLRWTRPDGEVVPPGRLVAFAESCGLTDALAGWVYERAITDAARWRSRGRPIGLSVNASPELASQSSRVEVLATQLADHHLEPRLLTIEITESRLMRSITGVAETLHGLRELGVGLSIDDFGTGSSTLSRLQELPFTEMKIDRSFVARAIEHPESARLVNFMAMLGRGLGLAVVAEGVETPDVLQLLRRCKIDRGQGYLFCRPVAAAEIPAQVDAIAARLAGADQGAGWVMGANDREPADGRPRGGADGRRRNGH